MSVKNNCIILPVLSPCAVIPLVTAHWRAGLRSVGVAAVQYLFPCRYNNFAENYTNLSKLMMHSIKVNVENCHCFVFTTAI